MSIDINEFAKQVEADLVAVNPDWAEYPFGTEAGILEQYGQTFDGVGTIFYYAPQKDADGEYFRNTLLLDMAREDSVPLGDGIDPLPPVTPPDASTLIYYGKNPPQTPALSPIWFDTETGDIRIFYSYNGNETWINTGVAGVGKIEFLNDLQDVDVLTTPPEDENHLQFDSAEQKWLPFDLNSYLSGNFSAINHTHALTEITDVTITFPQAEQVLTYVGGEWINQSVPRVEVWRGASPPTDPVRYPIWFNTTTAFTSIFFDDGTSEQWVSIGGSDARVTENNNANAFQARVSSSYTEGAGWGIVRCVDNANSSCFDTDNNYNNVNYRYTCPVDGIYEFNGSIRIDNLSHSSYSYLSLYKNGVVYNNVIEGNNESTNYQNISFHIIVKADGNDYFELWKYENSDTSHTINTQSWFSGGLKQAL